MTDARTFTVSEDDDGIRLDRWFKRHMPEVSFNIVSRWARTGQLRLDGKKAVPGDRIEVAQKISMPASVEAPQRPARAQPRRNSLAEEEIEFVREMVVFEDPHAFVLNKPPGLATQGGTKTTKHLDRLLDGLANDDGDRPKLVHRLDKDTSGCLLVAKTRFAAAALAKNFRSRSARKIYWALVAGVPRPRQGRVSTFLAKEEREDESMMRIARHGEENASHAVTYYAVVETAAQKLAWLSLKPVTGRTHQLRAHMEHIGHPIIGDEKYFRIENYEFPGGMQNKLHLLARRIAIPHPRGGGTIDVTAPLPPHMEQSWNLLGFDAKRYDPIVDAPED